MSKVWSWVKSLLSFIGTFGSDPNKVAQAGHVLAGLVVPLIFHLFGETLMWTLWGALGVDGVWGLPKEFWIDPAYEHQTIADGWNDWLHYAYGSIGAVGLVLLKGLTKWILK